MKYLLLKIIDPFQATLNLSVLTNQARNLLFSEPFLRVDPLSVFCFILSDQRGL